MTSGKAKLLLLFGTSIWGATFIFTKIGIEYTSPTFYIILRFCLAILLILIFFRKYILKINKKIAKQSVLLGLFFSVGFLLQTFALKYTSVNNTAFITELTVVITPFIFWIVSRQKIQLGSKIGVFVAFLGVIIMTDPNFQSPNLGDILTLLSTFCWAFYITYIDVFTKEADYEETDDIKLSIQFVFMQFVTGLPILLAYFLLFECNNFYFEPTLPLLVSVLFNGILASFLVSFIQMAVQKYTTPVNAALIYASEPIFACVFSFFFFGEVLTLQGYIGAGITLLAILIANSYETVIEKIKLKKNNT